LLRYHITVCRGRIVKQVIRFAVAANPQPHQAQPDTAWAVSVADENIVVKIPHHRLPYWDCKAGNWFAVAVKIRNPTTLKPATAWAVSVADKNIIVKIPYHRLLRGRIVKQVIRFAVAVKIGY
jgi:hypothetical protein